MWFLSQITGLFFLLNSADLEWGQDPGCWRAGRGLVLLQNPGTSVLAAVLWFVPLLPLPVCFIPEPVQRKLGLVLFPALSLLAVAGSHGSISHGWSSPGAHVP